MYDLQGSYFQFILLRRVNSQYP